ncbi:MAG: PEGA domain-containing protein [Candidatus Binatia bacterium]
MLLVVLVSTPFSAAFGDEEIQFESFPQGAQVYVDGVYIGDTPTRYTTDEVRAREYRITSPKNGETATGVIDTRVCPGRLTGTIFTLGILAAFKSVTCYATDRVAVDLTTPVAPGQFPAIIDAKIYRIHDGTVRAGTCDKRGQCIIADCTGEVVRQPSGTLKGSVEAGVARAHNAVTGVEVQRGAAAAAGAVELTAPGTGIFRCEDGILECSLAIAVVDGAGAGSCKEGKYRITLVPH